MKKQQWIVILCVLVLALFTACGHTHDYGSWKTKKEATCEKEGRKERRCDCGDVDEEKIPKLDHQFGDWTVKTLSTCQQEGSQERTCTVCGETEIGKLPKGAHSYGANAGAATCQDNSAVAYTCTVCGETHTETVAAKTYTATELYDLYRNSVGEIITYDKNGREFSLGSCFVQTADGKLITNYHVIEGAYSAKVTLGSQTYEIQQVLAYDQHIDVAILQIAANGLKPATICQLEHKVGQNVYAFGSSQGLTATFSDGMITSAKREADGVTYVQHSAPISSGNSGGPLINIYGEVIGINTMTLQDSQNLNLAVCVSELNNLDYSNPLTMSQFYDTENNAYRMLVNYVLSEGQQTQNYYILTLKEGYVSSFRANCTMFVLYYPSDGELAIAFSIGDSAYAGFVVDREVSGSYTWVYFDQYDYEMEGVLIASSYTSGTTLSCTQSNITNATTQSTLRKRASDMMYILCTNLTSGLQDVGITAADLDFVNF